MGLRWLTYALLVGVGFWTGVAHTIASRPIHPRIIRVAPPPEKAVMLIPCDVQGRIEHDRICRARARTALVKPKE